ncbi:DMT family transporter [Porphyromonadaceae bacterium]
MRTAFIKLHISIILAGFTGIFGKLITLNEGVLVWHRMFLASLLFYFILKMSKRSLRLPIKDVLNIALVGFVLAMHWLFFYGSIKASNVSIGVICFSLTGFFTALFEPLFDRRRFSAKEILYSFIAVVGILLIFQFDSRYRLGIGLGIISSAFCSVYTILNKRVSRQYPTSQVLFYTLSGGWFVFSLCMPIYLFLFPSPTLIPNLTDFVYLIVFVLFCTILMNILQIQALKQISAFTVNLSYNLEPVYSIIIAMILFKEANELNVAFYGGLGLIIASVILQTVALAKESRRRSLHEIANKTFKT